MVTEHDWNRMRDQIIGLGADSARKSFYPELQQRLRQLEETREHLRISQENLLSMFNSLHDAIIIHDGQGRILEANQSAAAMFETSQAALCKLTVMDISQVDPHLGDPLAHLQTLWSQMGQRGFLVFEWRCCRPGDAASLDVEVAIRPAKWYGEAVIAAVIRDITERKKTEAHLHQAQKLESLGQLAGGVAHDTNNMLNVILGYADILLENPLLTDGRMRAQVETIRDASLHSADFTRQLLAFARKQTIQPRPCDLNSEVDGILNLVRRLIGETHAIVWKPASCLWPVWIDPSQVDQVVVNLAVNARDAMDGTGVITLETANQPVDAVYAQSHPDAVPGDYVVLAVSDTGRGMDATVQARIFEPFFTTKEVGKGTGLGLSMIYGIIRQNGGFITVYSAPGRGTAFRLHVPRLQADPCPSDPEAARGPELPRGSETVLLVEDEEALLILSRTILEGAGYRVLATSSPLQALEWARREGEEIHLLATDMVMPTMGGPELHRELLRVRPRIKCLFMSGYPASTVAMDRTMDARMPFLQKPFRQRELLLKVREALTSYIPNRP